MPAAAYWTCRCRKPGRARPTGHPCCSALTGKIQRARQELQTLLAMNQDVIDPRELQRALDDLVVE